MMKKLELEIVPVSREEPRKPFPTPLTYLPIKPVYNPANKPRKPHDPRQIRIQA